MKGCPGARQEQRHGTEVGSHHSGPGGQAASSLPLLRRLRRSVAARRRRCRLHDALGGDLSEVRGSAGAAPHRLDVVTNRAGASLPPQTRRSGSHLVRSPIRSASGGSRSPIALRQPGPTWGGTAETIRRGLMHGVLRHYTLDPKNVNEVIRRVAEGGVQVIIRQNTQHARPVGRLGARDHGSIGLFTYGWYPSRRSRNAATGRAWTGGSPVAEPTPRGWRVPADGTHRVKRRGTGPKLLTTLAVQTIPHPFGVWRGCREHRPGRPRPRTGERFGGPTVAATAPPPKGGEGKGRGMALVGAYGALGARRAGRADRFPWCHSRCHLLLSAGLTASPVVAASGNTNPRLGRGDRAT
jgi:hypothetical protein